MIPTRVFLDANVLFSAAYSPNSGLRTFWGRPTLRLCTSLFAIEEARRNLAHEAQRTDLDRLCAETEVVREAPELFVWAKAFVRDKDVPILAAGKGGVCVILMTGDVRDFGALMQRADFAPKVMLPRDVLSSVA